MGPESDVRRRAAPKAAAAAGPLPPRLATTARGSAREGETARPTAGPTANADHNMRFTVYQLKAYLRERGLYVTGLKRDLAERLALREARAARTPTSWQDVLRLREMVIRGIEIPSEAFVYDDVAAQALTRTLRTASRVTRR